MLEDDLINREETVYRGQRTYYFEPSAEQLEFRLLMAGDMLSPFISEEDIESQSDVFTRWLMNL